MESLCFLTGWSREISGQLEWEDSMIFLPFVDKHFVLPPAIEECHLPGFVMGDGAKIISNLNCAAASSPLRCVTD